MDASGRKQACRSLYGLLVALECAVQYPKRISGISLMKQREMPVHPELLNAAKQSLAYDLVCSCGLGAQGYGVAPVPGMNF